MKPISIKKGGLAVTSPRQVTSPKEKVRVLMLNQESRYKVCLKYGSDVMPAKCLFGAGPVSTDFVV